MKKQLLLGALAFGILVSCKKTTNSHPSSNPYHLTATIDGQPQTFNQNVIGTRKILSNQTQINIQGANGPAGGVIPALSIGWANTSVNVNFGIGTWTDTSSIYTVYGVYEVTNSDLYESGTNSTGQASHDGIPITNHLKIIFTFIDSSTLKGTFSGDFYDMGTIPGTKKTITDGDFYVPFSK
jgi:hypothetical protein